MQPFDTWQKDPEFIELPLSEKAQVYLHYFDKEMADDEFKGLPEPEQRRIKTNFIHAQQVDLGAGPEMPEEGFIEKHIMEPYVKPLQEMGIPEEQRRIGLTSEISPIKPYQEIKEKVLADVKETLEPKEEKVPSFWNITEGITPDDIFNQFVQKVKEGPTTEIPHLNPPAFPPEIEMEMARKHPNLMAARFALASLLPFGEFVHHDDVLVVPHLTNDSIDAGVAEFPCQEFSGVLHSDDADFVQIPVDV